MELEIIARIRTPLKEKFGIPRQAGLVEELEGTIVFEGKYRVPEAFRGLDGFSHIWLIWGFSLVGGGKWSPTVRPPRLGGNERVGVFATRSPFRPNPIALSCVRLKGIEFTKEYGPVLHVSGVDMADGSPVYDIKPYILYADSKPDALSGFASESPMGKALRVIIPDSVRPLLSEGNLIALEKLLSLDPRPRYHTDSDRVYKMSFSSFVVSFCVKGDEVTVLSVEKEE